MRGFAGGLNIAQRVHMRVVVFPHPAAVLIDDLVNTAHGLLHFDDLIDLLLIAYDHKARAAVFKHISHLFSDGVLIQWHRHRTAHLRGDHRPIHRRTVAPDNGNEVTLFDAQLKQAQRNRSDLGLGLGPGPALPNAEFLLAIGRLVAKRRHVARKKMRNRDQRPFGRSSRCHREVLPDLHLWQFPGLSVGVVKYDGAGSTLRQMIFLNKCSVMVARHWHPAGFCLSLRQIGRDA